MKLIANKKEEIRSKEEILRQIRKAQREINPSIPKWAMDWQMIFLMAVLAEKIEVSVSPEDEKKCMLEFSSGQIPELEKVRLDDLDIEYMQALKEF